MSVSVLSENFCTHAMGGKSDKAHMRIFLYHTVSVTWKNIFMVNFHVLCSWNLLLFYFGSIRMNH